MLFVGLYVYKVVINNSWDENYGVGGVKDGVNISYIVLVGFVMFYYDYVMYYVMFDV